MRQARTISLALMVTGLPCIPHKLVSLKTSIMKYSTTSWREEQLCSAFAGLCFLFFVRACIQDTGRGLSWWGDLLFFGTYGSPLEPLFLGNSGEAFSCRLSVAQTLCSLCGVMKAWRFSASWFLGCLFERPRLVMFMVAGDLFRRAHVVTSLLCV